MSGIGLPGLIIILGAAFIFFGPKKLPEFGRAVGETIKEFKKMSKDIQEVTKESDETQIVEK